MNAKETLLTVLPEHSAEKVLSALTKDGNNDFEILSSLGWKTVGQRIVYGYERALGFAASAELCAQVEGMYKRLKRSHKFNQQNYVDEFITLAANTIVERMKGKI